LQGQNPEETGGVYGDIRRGFPKGDNAANDVLLKAEPELKKLLSIARKEYEVDGVLLTAEPRNQEVVEDFRRTTTKQIARYCAPPPMHLKAHKSMPDTRLD